MRAPDYLDKKSKLPHKLNKKLLFHLFFSKTALVFLCVNHYILKNTFSLENSLVGVQLMTKKSNRNTERDSIGLDRPSYASDIKNLQIFVAYTKKGLFTGHYIW